MLFHDKMHKEIEVYMNDMITKSNEEDDHVMILKKNSLDCVSTN
jgi:hypothetical protein